MILEKLQCVQKNQQEEATASVCTDVSSVSRLVEEVKQKCASVQLQTEDVYMATTFQDFIQMFVRRLRGEDQEEELVIDYVSPPLALCRCEAQLGLKCGAFKESLLLLYCSQATKDVNNMTVKMPYQCFINGKFEDAENGKTYDTINPTDGSVSHVNMLTCGSTHAHAEGFV